MKKILILTALAGFLFISESCNKSKFYFRYRKSGRFKEMRIDVNQRQVTFPDSRQMGLK